MSAAWTATRKAREVAVALSLKSLRLHESVVALAQEPEPQGAYAALESQARRFARNQNPSHMWFVREQYFWTSFSFALEMMARGFS